LRWSAGGPAGQHLIFEERGATGVLQRLGEKQGRGGTIHFTPAPGSGRRTLTALVLQGGHPRALLTVARFQAPRSAASGRVGSLTVTLSGRTTRLRWSGVKGAARYLVVVRTASGPVARLAGARARSLTVTDVATVKSATATITALDASGRRGPPRQASARAGRR
jgi:hypothetical protein